MLLLLQLCPLQLAPPLALPLIKALLKTHATFLYKLVVAFPRDGLFNERWTPYYIDDEPKSKSGDVSSLWFVQ